MVRVSGGIYRTQFRGGTNLEVIVKPFHLDALPVTNGDFLEFVRAHPAWRRSQIPRAQAEPGYLQHWAGYL